MQERRKETCKEIRLWTDKHLENSSDEIDRFTGKPFVRGLKPVGDIEDAANATPVGDAISAYDTYKALKNKDWEGAGLAAMGLIPFMPMTVKQFRSSYRGTKPKIKRPTPTVKKDATQKAIDQYMEQLHRNKMSEYDYLSDVAYELEIIEDERPNRHGTDNARISDSEV